MNFNERKEKFLSEYNALPSDMERFDYIINKGMRSACDYVPSEGDRIEGCDSGLWLCASADGGFVSVRAHSDAAYVMGLAALICELTDGLSISEAQEIDTSFPHEIPCVYPMTELRLSSMEKMLLKIKECTKNIL